MTNEQHFDSLPKDEQDRLKQFSLCAFCYIKSSCYHLSYSPRRGYYMGYPRSGPEACYYYHKLWKNSDYDENEAVWHCSKAWFNEWNLANQKVLKIESERELFKREVEQHTAIFGLFTDNEKQQIVDLYNNISDKYYNKAKQYLKQLEDIPN